MHVTRSLLDVHGSNKTLGRAPLWENDEGPGGTGDTASLQTASHHPVVDHHP